MISKYSPKNYHMKIRKKYFLREYKITSKGREISQQDQEDSLVTRLCCVEFTVTLLKAYLKRFNISICKNDQHDQRKICL